MHKDDFVFSVEQLKVYLRQKGLDMSRVQLPDTDEKKPTFYLLIPKYYIDRINWYDESDPLRQMVVINNLEYDIQDYEREDPIGDQSHSPVPGIIHRYPNRCLLMLTSVCAVHCRFCFRRNLLSKNKADFEKSITYIANNPQIWEVILSGGDPFMLTDSFLEKILRALSAIHHVKIVRFHTRVPAVYPQRITNEMIGILSRVRACSVVIHINHPREITKELREVADMLKKAGITLYSQTVLMKNINNSVQTLSGLFQQLVELGIHPYYLHHLDLTKGTHHFRISIEEGKAIMRKLKGAISGTCIPEYVIDTPGGDGKIPVFWFKKTSKNIYVATNYIGKRIVYKDYYSL